MQQLTIERMERDNPDSLYRAIIGDKVTEGLTFAQAIALVEEKEREERNGKLPTCPYCGKEMKLFEGLLLSAGTYKANYICKPCYVNSPLAECATRAEAVALAYDLAMRRAPKEEQNNDHH